MTLTKDQLEELMRRRRGFASDISQSAEGHDETRLEEGLEDLEELKKLVPKRSGKKTEEAEKKPVEDPQLTPAQMMASITDKNLQKLDPTALLSLDYMLQTIENGKLDKELGQIARVMEPAYAKKINYIIQAAELARMLKGAGASFSDIRDVFGTILKYRDHAEALYFVQKVIEAKVDTKYTTEVLDYLKRYGESGNKEDVLEVMRKLNSASDYVALDDLLKTLDSNRRTEIIDLLHKACRISAQNLKDMIKIADSRADSDALQFAKEVNRRKNPALKLTAYIALEHIVNAIERKHGGYTGRFEIYDPGLGLLKNKDTPLYKIVNVVDHYIERIDKKVKACKGTYELFHKPKYGCNGCLERKGCSIRNEAKEIKGLLRAAKAIAEDGENAEGGAYGRDR